MTKEELLNNPEVRQIAIDFANSRIFSPENGLLNWGAFKQSQMPKKEKMENFRIQLKGDNQPITEEQFLALKNYSDLMQKETGLRILITDFYAICDEKEWEIMTFKRGDDILGLDEDGFYRNIIYRGSGISAEKALEYKYEIHSVRRLSDNVEFKVGDKTQSGAINDFYICNDQIFLKIENGDLYNLRDAKHLKEALFKTEDGKEIFEGDEFYSLDATFHSSDRIYKETACFNWEHYKRFHKRFSTKEAAEEYILHNKPCLSFSEVSKILFAPKGEKSIIDNLEELVYSKINGDKA